MPQRCGILNSLPPRLGLLTSNPRLGSEFLGESGRLLHGFRAAAGAGGPAGGVWLPDSLLSIQVSFLHILTARRPAKAGIRPQQTHIIY